jgi:hypothetical protein
MPIAAPNKTRGSTLSAYFISRLCFLDPNATSTEEKLISKMSVFRNLTEVSPPTDFLASVHVDLITNTAPNETMRSPAMTLVLDYGMTNFSFWTFLNLLSPLRIQI